MSRSTLTGLSLSIILCSVEPTMVKNVPHHNIAAEQTRFATVKEQNVLSLNSKGLFFYEKNKDPFLIIPGKGRAEDRYWLGVGDFDKDEKNDIASVVHHVLRVYRNTSENNIPSYPSAQSSWEIPHEKTADEHGVVRDRESGFITDMNEDGLDDIVLANTTGCYILLNEGNFMFSQEYAIDFPRQHEWGAEPCPFDWNGDGKMDIIQGSSQGIFVSYNTKNGFSTPEKIAEVRMPKTSEDMNNYITNSSETDFSYVPHANWDDTIILKRGVHEGKNVLVAGTYYGFFVVAQDKILRLRLADEQGNFLVHLPSTGDHDHPDFVLHEDTLTYATKAGFFTTKLQNGFYTQITEGKILDGGKNDRAFLLHIETGYAVGTSRQLSFFY